MIKEKINAIKFEIAKIKLHRSRMKMIKHCLKIMKFSIYHAIKIGFPVTKGEIMAMDALLSVYDESAAELNKTMDRFRT